MGSRNDRCDSLFGKRLTKINGIAQRGWTVVEAPVGNGNGCQRRARRCILPASPAAPVANRLRVAYS